MNPFIFYLAAVAILVGLPANAQESSMEEEAADLEPIVVTGSRLERLNYETPQPVAVFTREELVAQGIGTIGDFADKLVYSYTPAEGNGTQVRTFEALNLRGLPSLVLINGRRMARYGDDDFQEVSVIPIWAIERIEVLKDGSSAVYGSDAISGVINIILRQDYQGGELSAKYLSTTDDITDETQLAATFGRSQEASRWLLTLTGLDRSYTAGNLGLARGDLFEALGFNRPGSFNPFGWPGTYVDTGTFTILPDPDCPPERIGPPLLIGQPVCAPASGSGTFGWISDTERYSGYGTFAYRLASGVELEAEALISASETEQSVSRVQVFGDANSLIGPRVPADHPHNPFGAQVEALITPGDVPAPAWMGSNDLQRYRLGANQALDRWDWSASVMYERSDGAFASLRVLDSARMQEALEGAGGPDGSQYYNPFGLDPFNPHELLDWLVTNSLGEFDSNQWLADFVARGDISEWSSGLVQLAAGLEYQANEIDKSGFAEDRDVGSAFVELELPVTVSLDVQLAARYDHYSDFGSTTNPKLAYRWQMDEDWMLRGSWGTSFRAPSLEELHAKATVGITFIPDPERCPVTQDPFDCQGLTPLVTSSNPDLDPEEGESWYLGLAWEPGFAEGLYVALDFWDFTFDNQVARIPLFVINDLYGDDPDIVVREEPSEEDISLGIPGPVVLYNQTLVNGEEASTKGLDLELSYLKPLGSGELRLRGAMAWQDTEEIIEIGRDPADSAGAFKPDLQTRLDVIWNHGPHTLTGVAFMQGSYTTVGLTTGFEFVEYKVDEMWTFDLQYAFAWDGLNTDLRVGCRNCLDEEPPFATIGAGWTLINDPVGLLLYAHLDWRFGQNR